MEPAPDNDLVFWLIWLPIMAGAALIIWLLIRKARRAKLDRKRTDRSKVD
jgi:hypothetical protein